MSSAERTDSNVAWEDQAGDDVAPGACGAGGLRSLLNVIADQISDADRRHGELLSEMQARLVKMEREARLVRGRVPREFAPAFERIEDGMLLLAERLADAGGVTHRRPHERTSTAEQRHDREPASPAAEQGDDAAPQPELPQAARRALDEVITGAIARKVKGERPSAPAKAASAEGSLSGNPDEPWDDAMAEDLAQHYETGASGLEAGGPAGQRRRDGRSRESAMALSAARGTAAPEIEREWLEERFADIASKVEQSLAEMRPEASLSEFGQRFEQFEQRMGSALDEVATRNDIESLRQLEGQIGDLAAHLDHAQAQLQRLEAIEQQLGAVMERLDEVPQAAAALAAAPGQGQASPAVDFEAIAEVTAERVASRVAQLSDGRQDGGAGAGSGSEEIRTLLEQFITERRHGEEQTATMLDTMQQALIRVLDRVDAIELANTQNAPASALGSRDREPARERREGSRATDFNAAAAGAGYAQHGHGGYGAMEDEGGADRDGRLSAFDRDDPMAGGSVGGSRMSTDNIPRVADTPPADRGAEQAAQRTPRRSVDKMRQDFIADAQRARERLSAAPDESLAADPAPQRRGRGSVAPEASTGRGGFSGQRLIVGALLLAVAIPALLLMIPRGSKVDLTAGKPDTPAPAAASEPVPAIEAPKAKVATPAAPAATGPTASDPGVNTPNSGGVQKTRRPFPAPGVQPQSGDRDVIESEARGFEEARAEQLPPAATTTGSTPRPPVGITVQDSGPFDITDLARLQQQQQQANMSTRLGAAAAKSSPIALWQDDAGAPQAGAPGGEASAGSVAGQSKSPLEMPPVTVGPLSLRLAAAQGDASAEFEVGARLAEGKGTQQDFKEALRWYQRSAAQGFAPAQYRLGTLYERGLGVKVDLARARVWYQRAAELGNTKAMHNLAVLSAGRSQAAPDYAAAAHWFNEAAERGLADSQFNLAVLYENGLGVAKDPKLAYVWFALAARSGDKEAIRRRDQTKSRLEATELSAGEDILAGWKAKLADPMVNDPKAAGEAWKRRSLGEGNT